MTSNPDDLLAEAFMRRAVVNAELKGQDIVAALRTAREAVANGEHLQPFAVVDEAVQISVRRIVAFLGRCYDENVAFEDGVQTLSAKQVWGDIEFVFGGGSDDEDTSQAILETIAKAAGR